MKLASVVIGGKPTYGAIVGDGFIDLTQQFLGRATGVAGVLAGNHLAEAAAYCARTKPDHNLSEVRFLGPIPNLETRVFALGWAYKAHMVETGKAEMEAPFIFSKHPQSLVGHGENLVKPKATEKYDFEGEIAIVIGKAGRNIPAEKAIDHIAGYTLLMDGSARDWQKHSVTAGKNFDASSAWGPYLVTKDEISDPKKMVLTTRLNGVEMQNSGFDLMAWDLGFLVNYVSTMTRLEPGDTISTGTPAGVGNRREPPLYMKAGDVLEVEATGLGVLRNTVIDEK